MSEIVALLKFTPLIQELRKIHIRLGELLEYNPRGTLQLMIDYNALQNLDAIHAYSAEVPMEIQHSGDDPQKTWNEYKNAIRKFMRDVCLNSKLASYQYVVDDAITVLSDHLWNEYYRRYPCWPVVGNTNEAYIYISTTHTYRHPNEGMNNFMVVWNCTGDVMVKDSRPNGKYHAHLKGSPMIKILFIETSLLTKLEQMISVPSLEEAKAKVDEKATVGTMALTWKDI